MITLNELASEILKIRNTIDTVEVRGAQNRFAVTDAYERCNYLIEAIQNIAEEVQNRTNNGSNTEEGEISAVDP